LVDYSTGVESPPFIVQQVDKSNVIPSMAGPVSQMQKLALCRKDPDGRSVYACPKNLDDAVDARGLRYEPLGSGVGDVGKEDCELDRSAVWTVMGVCESDWVVSFEFSRLTQRFIQNHSTIRA